MADTIYDFVRQEEERFKTDEIQVGDNMKWNFRNHVQMIFHMKNGYFFTGDNDYMRAFDAVMEPMLMFAYWTEDLEVKEIVFYIEERIGRVLSFFIKKYHDERYVKEHDIDAMLDEITQSDVDYGGIIAQKGVDRPEILPLTSLAFCDQTDALGGPLALKYHFTPSKLRSMSKFGWGDKKKGATITLDDLCDLATNDKNPNAQAGVPNKTTGKTIEVYIVRGNLPESYLKEGGKEDYHCNQLQIVALYTNGKGEKQGETLYAQTEEEGALKFFASKPVDGRALGRGVGESVIHDQIWKNMLNIYKMEMLEAGSKSGFYTDDASYASKNEIQNMENNEITTVSGDSKFGIKRLETMPLNNIVALENAANAIYNHAQLQASAFNPGLGVEQTSGTTFRGQNQLVAQGKGPHEWRKGRRAKFVEDIYRSWIIPDMVKEILSGTKFLASLSVDEMNWVADQLATNHVNQRIIDMTLDGKVMTKEDQAMFTQTFKQDFFKKGNKHLLEILKDDFKDIEIKIGINVANKQKNLAILADKILSIIEQAATNPAFKQNIEANGLTNSLNDLLEYSGISQADFATFTQMNMNPQLSPIQPQDLNKPA